MSAASEEVPGQAELSVQNPDLAFALAEVLNVDPENEVYAALIKNGYQTVDYLAADLLRDRIVRGELFGGNMWPDTEEKAAKISQLTDVLGALQSYANRIQEAELPERISFAAYLGGILRTLMYVEQPNPAETEV